MIRLKTYNGKVVNFFKRPMAVPKKKTSKSKRDHRRAHWRLQAAKQAQRALSLGKSILTGRSNSFVYEDENEDEE